MEGFQIPEDADPFVSWRKMLNKNDSVIRIKKDIVKKEVPPPKPKRKRRTKAEILEQQQQQKKELN